MNNIFIVQLDDSPTFLTSLRNGKPYGTSYPTQAIPMTFDAATELSNHLRGQGYEPTVVDRFGQPPTAADLAAVKRAVEYQVAFHGKYFCQNPKGQDCGATDRGQAANMSQEAALIVCRRLKKNFPDATVIESSSSPTIDVNEELSKIWPEEFTIKK
jgi:hypothetical protein